MRHLDPVPRPRSIAFSAGALFLLLFGLGTATAEPRSAAFTTRHRPLVKALRSYLDRSVPHYQGWSAVEAIVEPWRKSGDAVLADPDRLRWLTEQARSFDAPFEDRNWRRDNRVSSYRRHGRLRNLVSETLQMSWTTPAGYDVKNAWRRYPRKEPRPWLVSLHDERDVRGREPAGVAMLKRRWPYAKAKDLYDRWLVLAPEAPAGEFVRDDGIMHLGRTVAPMQAFWRSYHVDFDRIVLEGSTDAIDLAAAFPYWLAGIVLRGGTLDGGRKRSVRNFEQVPVYVVDDKRLAAALRLEGHQGVTLGDAEGVLAWMESQRRRLPARYRYDVTHPFHARSHWVQVEARDPAAARSTLEVQTVDTPKEKNTIRIEARGVRSLTVYLDDRVVDLDRPVRIVINGSEVYTARVAHGRFARDPVAIWSTGKSTARKQLHFADLFPGQAARLEVPKPR